VESKYFGNYKNTTTPKGATVYLNGKVILKSEFYKLLRIKVTKAKELLSEGMPVEKMYAKYKI